MEKNEFGLPPVYYNALVAGAEAFFQTTGKALAAALGTADTKPSPMDPSYPPAYTADVALDNIRHGYGYTGLRDGRRLDDATLTEKLKEVDEAVAYFAKRGVPEDMAEYGFLYGLTAFIGPRPFGSPNADLAEFVGKSLQTWLDQEWAIRAGGGTPSIGGGSRV